MKIIKAKITKDSTLVATYKDENGTTTVEGKNLVIATVAKVSRKRGLWLVVRVNKSTCAKAQSKIEREK